MSISHHFDPRLSESGGNKRAPWCYPRGPQRFPVASPNARSGQPRPGVFIVRAIDATRQAHAVSASADEGGREHFDERRDGSASFGNVVYFDIAGAWRQLP